MTEPALPEGLAALEARLVPGWVSPEVAAARVDVVLGAPVPPYTLALDAPLTRSQADVLLASRRMVATRLLVASARRDAISLLSLWHDGMPDVRPAARSLLTLIEAVEAEVHAAERGCGQPDGECTDPCHTGVLAPPD